MKGGFCAWIVKQNKAIKILLAFPLIDLSWWVYRFLISKDDEDTFGMVFAVILALISLPVAWIIDIVFLSMDKPVLWL